MNQFTYNPPTRNKFNVWSYADDRAPPGKISAHSDPIAFNSSGCKYSPNAYASAVDTIAIIRNLKWENIFNYTLTYKEEEIVKNTYGTDEGIGSYAVKSYNKFHTATNFTTCNCTIFRLFLKWNEHVILRWNWPAHLQF